MLRKCKHNMTFNISLMCIYKFVISCVLWRVRVILNIQIHYFRFSRDRRYWKCLVASTYLVTILTWLSSQISEFIYTITFSTIQQTPLLSTYHTELIYKTSPGSFSLVMRQIRYFGNDSARFIKLKQKQSIKWI